MNYERWFARKKRPTRKTVNVSAQNELDAMRFAEDNNPGWTAISVNKRGERWNVIMERDE